MEVLFKKSFLKDIEKLPLNKKERVKEICLFVFPKIKKDMQKIILTVIVLIIIIASALLWVYYLREEKIEEPESNNACIVDEDCVVFGKTGDCNCGCYNKNHLPEDSGGKCFCQAPVSCKCVEGKCEGIFEESAITNFKECIEAGNPVMESYPRQYRTAEGDIFTEEHCVNEETGSLLTLEEAREIAKKSDCGDKM